MPTEAMPPAVAKGLPDREGGENARKWPEIARIGCQNDHRTVTAITETAATSGGYRTRMMSPRELTPNAALPAFDELKPLDDVSQ